LARIQERLARLRPRLGEGATRDLGELLAERIRMLTPGGGPASPPAPGGVSSGKEGGGGGGGGGGGARGGRVGPPDPDSAPAEGEGEGMSVNDQLALSCGQSRVQLGVNMAATAVHKDGREEPVVLWFALIDILQPYNTTKRLEHGLKSVIHSAQSISVTHPNTYANRFQAFMKMVFE
ncbi:hypothetical protein PLESTM_001860000, partial [Pleodorina starrii]